MTLEKSTQRFLKLNAEWQFTGTDLDELRAMSTEIHSRADVPQVDVYRELDKAISGPRGDIPLRLYWPVEAQADDRLPILVTFHGGGWVLGNLDIHDNCSRYLCKYAKMIVVSVDYRLAPEHKFPAGIEDSFAALQWTAENAASLGGDAAKICVGGDSAGGNISAVLCHMARQQGGPAIWKQLLFYPCVTLADDANYPSRSRNGTDQYGLRESDLVEYRALYLNDERDYSDIRVSPILAEDFSGLPAALVITAEYDPLLDEGAAYAERLQAAGVHTEYRCYKGVIHGFMLQSGIVGVGLEALNDAAAFLRKPLPLTK